MTTAIIFIAILVICIGAAMLIKNPYRLTNQVFAIGSLLLFAELLALFISTYKGDKYADDQAGNPLFWVRASAALKSFLPAIIWMLRSSIINPNKTIKYLSKESAPWLMICAALATITLTNWYIPADSLPNKIIKGPAYPIASSAIIILWIIITTKTISDIRRTKGIQSIEMQFLALNLSTFGLAITGLFSAGHIFNIQLYKTISILLIIVPLTIMACGLFYHRIFNIREILFPTLKKIAIASLITPPYYLLYLIIEKELTNSAYTILPIFTIALTALLANQQPLSRSTKEHRLYFLRFRKAAEEIAKSEPCVKRLTEKLKVLLCDYCNTSVADFLFPNGNTYSSKKIKISISSHAHKSICIDGWATPESSERKCPTKNTLELRGILESHNLGLLISSPHGSTKPNYLLALGIRANSTPYTYPEIERIQHLAEFMDHLLTRAELNAQAELKTRLENLAVMSRGLAHDLKNLITPVSTFLSACETEMRLQAKSDPVYVAAHRAMRMITDYVEEAHFFSKQLHPKLEMVNPSELINDVVLTLRDKADRAGIAIEIGPCPGEPLQADRVLLQRLIANLVDNAIDASNSGGVVSLQARWTHDQNVIFSIVDSGAGIPAEILPRIFEPYFTTKDRGPGVRGFGLGLAICRRIVDIHQGKISVRSTPGCGTTFEVSLPTSAERLLALQRSGSDDALLNQPALAPA